MNTCLWKQERKGEFIANVIPRGQCGFVEGQHTFTYEVVIYVRQLDNDGWVKDNREIDVLFDKWRSGLWRASCEDLAGGGVQVIMDALGDRAERIECSISPNPFATMTCIWERGDGPPMAIPIPAFKMSVEPRKGNHEQAKQATEAKGADHRKAHAHPLANGHT